MPKHNEVPVGCPFNLDNQVETIAQQLGNIQNNALQVVTDQARINQSLFEKIDYIKVNLNPDIILKNGKVTKKKQTEAISETWQRVNKLDERTLVLEEITKFVNSIKNIKQFSTKFIHPVFKALWKTGLAAFLLYFLHLVFIGEMNIVDLIKAIF